MLVILRLGFKFLFKKCIYDLKSLKKIHGIDIGFSFRNIIRKKINDARKKSLQCRVLEISTHLYLESIMSSIPKKKMQMHKILLRPNDSFLTRNVMM